MIEDIVRPMNMTFQPFAARTHEEMKDVLMHPDAPGPTIHYYMIRGGTQKRNVTVWESGTVGGEYIKAYGHYHISDLKETYWIAQGSGILLLQRMISENGAPQPARIEEFKAIMVKTGESVPIPIGFGHSMVNVGAEWLVTIDDSPVEGAQDSASMPGHADYSLVKQMHGFAYYVVEKDGMPALVKNPLYTEVLQTDFGGIPFID